MDNLSKGKTNQSQSTASSEEQLPLRVTRVQFNFPLQPRQMIVFRGAIANKAGLERDLFHNHATGRSAQKQLLHYRYPLIQYQLFRGKAMILGIGEGADELEAFVSEYDGKLFFQNEYREVPIRKVTTSEVTLRALPKPKTYHIRSWIALNSENLKEWNNLVSYADKVTMLENILARHIIAFYKNWDWYRPRIEVNITSSPKSSRMTYKRVSYLTFELDFLCNVELPNHIGLGKAVSEGFGRCWEVK